MVNQHPGPKIDPTSFICPVGGEFLCGFTAQQVLSLRQSASRNDQDPDQLPGSEWYASVESPTCGSLKIWFKQGVYDGDGYNSITRIEFTNLPVPCFGHRHIVRKSADQTGVGSSATDVSGLGVAVTAGRQIHFRCWLAIKTSATSIGGMVSVNGPSATNVLFETVEWTSATAQSFGGQVAFDNFSSQTTGNGATTRAYKIEGVAAFTADGTFVPRVKAESGGTLDVLAGSFMEFDLI